jgi:hypothetical protein
MPDVVGPKSMKLSNGACAREIARTSAIAAAVQQILIATLGVLGGEAREMGPCAARIISRAKWRRQMLALNDALARWAAPAQIVSAALVGGKEIARSLGITARTVRRDWVKRAWLYRALYGCSIDVARRLEIG